MVMIRTCAVVLFFVLGTLINYAQQEWKLIYENDADGKNLQGEFNDLLDAVRGGKPVKIYYKMGRDSEPEVFVEHLTDAKFLTILNSPHGLAVTAQIDCIVGQTPMFEEKRILLKENLEWCLITSTSGVNDMLTRNTITGEILNHQVRRWGTKWFVSE